MNTLKNPGRHDFIGRIQNNFQSGKFLPCSLNQGNFKYRFTAATSKRVSINSREDL